MTAAAAVSQTETELIVRAQSAVSHCNWEVGECAAIWTKRFAKGRTDADFAVLVGLSPDQVYQRRRTWETFGDVFQNYSHLKWSHFYGALNWDDAAECLQWAEEIQASVAEMKAWRRAQRGEDLSVAAEDESFSMIPTEPVPVRIPGESDFSGRGDASSNSARGEFEAQPLAASVARASGEENDADAYAPFREGAAHAPGTSERPAGPKVEMTAEQLVRKLTTTLERCHAVITDQFVAEFSDVKEKSQRRFLKAFEQLQEKLEPLL